MPLYDYTCSACGDFRLLRSMVRRNAPARCPDCKETGSRLILAPALALMSPQRRKAFCHQRAQPSRTQSPVSPHLRQWLRMRMRSVVLHQTQTDAEDRIGSPPGRQGDFPSLDAGPLTKNRSYPINNKAATPSRVAAFMMVSGVLTGIISRRLRLRCIGSCHQGRARCWRSGHSGL